MSLTKSSDDGGEGDDDDFGDTISLLEGKTPGAHSRRQRRTGGISSDVICMMSFYNGCNGCSQVMKQLQPQNLPG